MEEEKSLKCETIVSLVGIIFFLLVGLVLTTGINFYGKKLFFPFCYKSVLKCFTWLIIFGICIFLIKQPIRFLFKLFERMYIFRGEALKNLPIVISVFLALYLLPLPLFLFFGDSSIYIEYSTILTSILGLNGLFTFFIAGENVKRDAQKDAQHKYKVNDNEKWRIKGFKITEHKDGKFRFKIEDDILLVDDYLRNGSGDNLWNPMNDWYENLDKKNYDYPLFNARSNNWNGNDEWYRQLNDFVDYLEKTDLLDKSAK